MKMPNVLILPCSCIFSDRKKRVEAIQKVNHWNVEYACYQMGIRNCADVCLLMESMQQCAFSLL